MGTWSMHKLTLRKRPTTSLAPRLLFDVSRPTPALHADDGLSGRSPIKLMWACTATTATEHNLQMRPLADGTCDPMSEGVGPAQQRSGTDLPSCAATAQVHCCYSILRDSTLLP